jgi:hypothetical protein
MEIPKMSNQVQAPTHTAAQLNMIYGINPVNGQTNLPTHIQAALTAQPKGKKTYAAIVNAKRKSNQNNIFTLKDRWDDAMNSLTASQKAAFDMLLKAAKAEFKRRHPNLKSFSDMRLVSARLLPLSEVNIDDTMQRMLIIKWVLTIMNNFTESMVVPVQVYKDSITGKYHAWDGQHTALALYLIATEIFGEDPATVQIPVNISHSTLKSEIRDNFIKHNGGEGKQPLDPIDIFIQMVFGVRIDSSKDPSWITAEAKQQQLEKHDLFVTADKFNDAHLPGAISRLQEINKMDVEAVGWLCRYLSKVGCDHRPADEKEMVMMGAFFDQCHKSKIKVDDAYIDLLADTALMLWNADFDPTGPFWAKAGIAYKRWHKAMNIPTNYACFKKEFNQGMPFLMAQLRKSFALPVPNITTSSAFVPAASDLF